MQDAVLILYGSAAAQETAKHILEGLLQIRRADAIHHSSQLHLVLSEQIKETNLIPLLRKSGIHGFRLVE